MGSAIIAGLLTDEGIMPSNLSISDPHAQKLSYFKEKGVNIYIKNSEAVKDADVIVLAVKPWVVKDVVEEIRSHLDLKKSHVCSIAAGISGDDLKILFGDYLPENLSRAIPNTAMTVKESMTFVVNNSGECEIIVNLFEKLGKVIEIDERHLSGAMALASCGIAFAMRYVRAACEGGVELGFRASEAQDIVCQTIKGAAALLSLTGSHPETEIDKVTTPGGYTIRGLNAMEKAGFTNSVIEGLKACGE